MSSFIDGLMIPISFFVMMISLVIVCFIFTTLSTNAPSLFTGVIGPLTQTFNLLKMLVPMFLLFMALGAIVSAFLIRTHPVFLAINIILLLVQMLITPMLTNMWSSLMFADPALLAEASTFTFALLLFDHLPLISFVMSVLVILVSYMRGIQ